MEESGEKEKKKEGEKRKRKMRDLNLHKFTKITHILDELIGIRNNVNMTR